MHIRVGTRRSLLAMTQSKWVAAQLQALDPLLEISFVGIETQGDRILDVPLTDVPGKDFFVQELDQALLAQEVDITVHSMKDLSLDRPDTIMLAAVPKRENPRDMLILHEGAGKHVRLGSSAPRRMALVPGFMQDVLGMTCDMVPIRGNVPTRLAHSDVDGVILAAAGIARLAEHSLLQGKRYAYLPLTHVPGAPAQGALAIECLTKRQDIRDLLAKIHDEKSARHAHAERQVLADWGGGCHQPLGATSFEVPGLGAMLIVRGVRDGRMHEEFRWSDAPVAPSHARYWDGMQHRPETRWTRLPHACVLKDRVFVAHPRALDENLVMQLQGKHIYVSGLASWKALVQRGLWVEGCAEERGWEYLLSQVADGDWTILTHAGAQYKENVIETYKGVHGYYDPATILELERATHIYWSSVSQVEELLPRASTKACMASGPGKTAQYLESRGIKVQRFPSYEYWKEWSSCSDV